MKLDTIIGVPCIILAFAYTGLTGYFFFLNPHNWIYDIWRYPILGIPYYSPYVHDTFFFGLLTITLYFKIGFKAWIGTTIAWFTDETGFNITNITNWKLFNTIDPYFYFKISFFALALILILLYAIKTKYQFNINSISVICFIFYWCFWTAFQATFPIPLTQTIMYVLTIFLLVGMVNKWEVLVIQK